MGKLRVREIAQGHSIPETDFITRENRKEKKCHVHNVMFLPGPIMSVQPLLNYHVKRKATQRPL